MDNINFNNSIKIIVKADLNFYFAYNHLNINIEIPNLFLNCFRNQVIIKYKFYFIRFIFYYHLIYFLIFI